MMRPQPLPKARRQAFAKLIRSARKAAGLTFQGAADAACIVLGDPEGPSWRYVQHLETGPPAPLANLVWLGALLESLGLGWYEVLQSLGIGDAMYPIRCPDHPTADGPLVGFHFVTSELGRRRWYAVQCPACPGPGPDSKTRNGAIDAWNRVAASKRPA